MAYRVIETEGALLSVPSDMDTLKTSSLGQQFVRVRARVAPQACEQVDTEDGALVIVSLHGRRPAPTFLGVFVPGAALDDDLSCASLTPREREVAQLVRAGFTNAEISEALAISRETVRVHVRNGRRKLGSAPTRRRSSGSPGPVPALTDPPGAGVSLTPDECELLLGLIQGPCVGELALAPGAQGEGAQAAPPRDREEAGPTRICRARARALHMTDQEGVGAGERSP